MKEFYNNHLWLRVITKASIVILILFIIIIIGAFLFLKFWPQIGGRSTDEDYQKYKERGALITDNTFRNEVDVEILTNNGPNNFTSTKGKRPKDEIKTVKPEFIEKPGKDEFSVTWLGHSTVFIQIDGKNIIVDPMFSTYSSPLQIVGPKRFSYSPVNADDLPDIDYVLITHDHYDHLDYDTIKDLDKKVSKFIVPLGVDKHLLRWGIDENKIIDMAWWEEYEDDTLLIACTPAQHYSNRSINDHNFTLWASFVLKGENYSLYDSGDSGFGPHFDEINEKYGDFDLALIEDGQYDNNWASIHMKPEESVKAGKILNANVIMPIHWGAFSLANHPWDDSVIRFKNEAEKENIKAVTPEIGKTITNETYETYESNWWENYN